MSRDSIEDNSLICSVVPASASAEIAKIAFHLNKAHYDSVGPQLPVNKLGSRSALLACLQPELRYEWTR
jgi:hypothetical protein